MYLWLMKLVDGWVLMGGLAQMPPQWPQLPLDGQDDPLIAKMVP